MPSAPSRVSVCRRPPQVNPPCPGARPRPHRCLGKCARGMSHRTILPGCSYYWNSRLGTQRTLPSQTSLSCTQDLQISAQPRSTPRRLQSGLRLGLKFLRKVSIAQAFHFSQLHAPSSGPAFMGGLKGILLQFCFECKGGGCSACNPVRLFVTPWTAAPQVPLSSIISWSLLKFMSIESVENEKKEG